MLERDLDISKKENRDSRDIAWSTGLLTTFKNKNRIDFQPTTIGVALYRPFSKTNLYFGERLVERPSSFREIFRRSLRSNRVIAVSGVGAHSFSALMSDSIVDYQTLFNTQCFPLLVEEPATSSLFDTSEGLSAKVAIRADVVKRLSQKLNLHLNDNSEFFYYVYGVLHSQIYREAYADNLRRSLPRIPLPRSDADFREFAAKGRILGNLHVNYESAPSYDKCVIEEHSAMLGNNDRFRVERMKFAGTRERENKTSVIYNEHITIKNIPLEAYEYVVNGKPALEWVMERQCVKVDKDSGIVNDANDYAIETMNNPAYPLELFQRVITVSLETMKIVKSLPPLDL